MKLFRFEAGIREHDYDNPTAFYIHFFILAVGFEFYGNLAPSWETRRRLREWWKCDQCGGRFGKCDESVSHVPF